MKRYAHYIIGLILVAATLAAVWWGIKDTKHHDDQTLPQTADTTRQTSTKACQIFTLAEAKTLLGTNARGGSNSPQQPSVDLDISICTYSQGDTTSSANRQSASLLVRSPKTDKGTTSNQNEFGPLRPSTVQAVDGYGDSAYWDSQHGQLNILKHDNWYILSYGATSPASRSLDQSRQLADLLIDKL